MNKWQIFMFLSCFLLLWLCILLCTMILVRFFLVKKNIKLSSFEYLIATMCILLIMWIIKYVTPFVIKCILKGKTIYNYYSFKKINRNANKTNHIAGGSLKKSRWPSILDTQVEARYINTKTIRSSRCGRSMDIFDNKIFFKEHGESRLKVSTNYLYGLRLDRD